MVYIQNRAAYRIYESVAYTAYAVTEQKPALALAYQSCDANCAIYSL